MTITGIVNKIQRAINQKLKAVKKRFSRPSKKKMRVESKETEIPRKWLREPRSSGKRRTLVLEDDGKTVVIKKKKVYKVSWLRSAKRMLAGLLLFVNFVISQFLLVSGSDAAPSFIFFLANCFIFLDYLWKTRSAGE